MKIEILRTHTPHATYGDAYVKDETGNTWFEFKTLELPWKNNERMVSCIPSGEYTVVKMKPTSKRNYYYFHVCNVKNRDSILFHPGNYTSDILGCILPGDKHVDLNKDGLPDIANTKATLKKLTDILPDNFRLIIKKKE
jgi:hypothetical protein